MAVKNLCRQLTGVLVLLLLAAPASADYVCSTTYIPGSSSLGNEGYVYASYYSGANCTGSFVRSLYYCTDGASGNSNCAYTPALWYNETSIIGLIDNLVEAAREGQRVTPITTSCVGGGTGCGAYVYFYGN